MARKYSLVIAGVSASYSAYVPELPTILVTGRSIEELTTRAAEAIRLYRESGAPTGPQPPPFARSKVELPVCA
jgi:predicted RNase H-like HicB family nuclease